MSRLLGIGALLLTLAMPAAAQAGDQPVRLRLLLDDAPSVGRKAPAIVLPYATRSGVGPADQPFTLAREIGRVVVLVFYPGNFTAASTAEWQALRERSATLAPEGVVLVGISTDSLVSHVRFASDLDLPFKLLSDADRAIIQRYGVADGPRARRAVVVVGADGTVRYLDPAFAVLDPESYVHLAAAIRAAKENR
ncbi:MAG: redoxin domain-containing protein [Gemmatimonadales bacterium]|jgi:peroxiredoxin Q/BCP|nr:redoxin domain-containing protein [Gemmatimonadales bacterium]